MSKKSIIILPISKEEIRKKISYFNFLNKISCFSSNENKKQLQVKRLKIIVNNITILILILCTRKKKFLLEKLNKFRKKGIYFNNDE